MNEYNDYCEMEVSKIKEEALLRSRTMKRIRNPIIPGGTYRREEPKVGRNTPCPCGSGRKYKKCCLLRG